MRYSSDLGTGQKFGGLFFFPWTVLYLSLATFKHTNSSKFKHCYGASSWHKHSSRFGIGIPLRFVKNNSHLYNFAIMIEISTSRAQIRNKFFWVSKIREKRKHWTTPVFTYSTFICEWPYTMYLPTDGKLGKMVNRR